MKRLIDYWLNLLREYVNLLLFVVICCDLFFIVVVSLSLAA